MIELVIVVAVTTVIMAVAIVRISAVLDSGPESAVASDLATLQTAIELYSAEHNGQFPTGDTIARQLTLYTDQSGQTSEVKTFTHIYEPYVREIPPVPIGPAKGSTLIATTSTGDGHWIYSENSGRIRLDTGDEVKARDGGLLSNL